MNSRVFLVENPARNSRFDVSKAEAYGELVFLCEHVSPIDLDGTKDKLKKALLEQQFNSETDYICLTGKTLALHMLIGVLAASGQDIRFLVFDARVSDYAEQKVGFAA